MDQPIEELEHEGFRIRIFPDDLDGDGPREWDNLGIMVCLHDRYKLGDRQELEYDEETALKYGGWTALEKHLRRNGAIGPILPVALYDHSGLHIFVGKRGDMPFDTAGWDTSNIGFIYATKETQQMCGTPDELIEECLRGEIETYDQFLRGDVYGYVVDPADKSLRDVPMPWITNNSYGDIIHDSCWGFYGMDECIAGAKGIAEAMKPDLDRAIAARTAKYAGGEVLEGAHA